MLQVADRKFLLSTETSLLPVPGLIKNVITVSTDTIATEESRETAARWHHFLRDTHLILWLRLTDNKFADLNYC
jgi:hypothetical protein